MKIKLKNSVIAGLLASFLGGSTAFADEGSLKTQILNDHNQNQIIYLLNQDGELIKLNDGIEDNVPDSLSNIYSIQISDDGFFAISKDGEPISSEEVGLPKGIKAIKQDRGFVLLENGKVFFLKEGNSEQLQGINNAKDIKALSGNVVLVKHEDETFSVIGNSKIKIKNVKNLTDVVEAVVYGEFVFIIKKNGSVIGFGEEYNSVSNKADLIKNGKKFIQEDENLYVVTLDNKAIPLFEKGFKAPEEYLENVKDIKINRFSSGENVLYKSYFITGDGKIIYYLQSNNEISDFNKQKIEYLGKFDNVKSVYDSGYLTIVLHNDGSITIPYNIHHELNGVTGVKDVVLNNQSYVVYFEDGQVATSLQNFVLNSKKSQSQNNGELNLYNYLNNIYINLLNKEISLEEFENLKQNLLLNIEGFKNFIREASLDRKFLMIDDSYDQVINTLYKSILKTSLSSDEYNHMKVMIIDKMVKENKTKKEIVNEIVNYIFENPIFLNIFNNFSSI